ncbi:hypothetical protein [Furfurilactobacillus rossiae]|uniref:Uncharacterized protein n=1 Tax=Furfurilactobacillus rossiae DSM 15814 TaxID=1114972 RepID=A0A0R1RGY8_9LACO|nr:hypothetical protein [Furfurilactobacillus rossiae]KRL56189.1 hypothetical protein FD35_GL002231 [Furfurilactobacillus rossiae DSM 15814]QFR66209.1 hypothetical protein LR814_03380 [Furfurilactobacillus rossiae]QLE61647.1 hypothetical protein LROSRS0_1601 [Furfurilactobacillus rossiae]
MSFTTPITKQEQQVFHDYQIPVHDPLSVFDSLKQVPNMTGNFEGSDVDLNDLLSDYVAVQLDFNRLVDTINQEWWSQLQTWHKLTGDRLSANTKAHADQFGPFEQERVQLAKQAEQGFPQELLNKPRSEWRSQDLFGYDYIMFQVDLKWEFFNIMEILANINPDVNIETVATEIQAKLAPKHGPKERKVDMNQPQSDDPDNNDASNANGSSRKG